MNYEINLVVITVKNLTSCVENLDLLITLFLIKINLSLFFFGRSIVFGRYLSMVLIIMI